ncbi:MAG: RNA-binding protein [Chthoniobacteraceae bacterium]
MKSQDPRDSGKRGRGPRRSSRSRSETRAPQTPAKKTLWQKIIGIFKSDSKPSAASPARARTTSNYPPTDSRATRKHELVEVTTAKLYVGNLSYDAGESDLFELFKGVGQVRNAEIVAHKHNDKSKGFGFVTMATVDEARRAVTELHDKEFMGRKLVVSGAKSSDREPNYRG